MRLPEAFLTRMKTELGDEYESFVCQYSMPPIRGLRVNTLKTDLDSFKRLCPWSITPSGIIDESFVLNEDVAGIGVHPYHIAGLFYMQEPSAASPVASIDEYENKRILDMCAAPGGKSGAIAARMHGTGLLVSNEIVKKRAVTLVRTLERLGTVNTVVTNDSPDDVAAAFPEYFDAVFVDAPCSGEGMFRKDEGAILEWSQEHVRSCSVRQGLILQSAARCVRHGGAIVYSTCTFSREENENVVERFLRENTDFSLADTHRYYPHTCSGEGHFTAKLVRNYGAKAYEPEGAPPQRRHKERPSLFAPMARCDEFDEFFAETLCNDTKLCRLRLGDSVRLLSVLPDDALKGLHIVSLGVDAGEVIKGRFEPSHSLFMAALDTKFKRTIAFPHDDKRLASFLAGETIDVPEGMKGFCAVAVEAGGNAFPVGFGKAVDGTLKNRLPKGLRINRGDSL